MRHRPARSARNNNFGDQEVTFPPSPPILSILFFSSGAKTICCRSNAGMFFIAHSPYISATQLLTRPAHSRWARCAETGISFYFSAPLFRWHYQKIAIAIGYELGHSRSLFYLRGISRVRQTSKWFSRNAPHFRPREIALWHGFIRATPCRGSPTFRGRANKVTLNIAINGQPMVIAFLVGLNRWQYN